MRAIREDRNLIIVDFFDKQLQDYGPFHLDITTVSSEPFTNNLVAEMYVSMQPRASVIKQEVYKVYIRPSNSVDTYKISIVWEDGPEKEVTVEPPNKQWPVHKTYVRLKTNDFRNQEYYTLCTAIEEAKGFWREYNKGIQGK